MLLGQILTGSHCYWFEYLLVQTVPGSDFHWFRLLLVLTVAGYLRGESFLIHIHDVCSVRLTVQQYRCSVLGCLPSAVGTLWDMLEPCRIPGMGISLVLITFGGNQPGVSCVLSD